MNQTRDNIAQMRPVSRFTLPLPNKKHRRSIMAAVGVLLMAISLASGLMALGILKKSQPADLLR